MIPNSFNCATFFKEGDPFGYSTYSRWIGARQGELFALEWADIDLDKAVIRFRRSLKDDEGGVRSGSTKTKGERSLSISATSMRLLLLHRKRQARSRLVFPNETGGFQNHRNFNRRHWAKALKAAELESGLDFIEFSLHDLRHTMATMALRDGMPIATVAHQLGHKKVSTTRGYYAHALPQDDALSADAFERRFRAYSFSDREARPI